VGGKFTEYQAIAKPSTVGNQLQHPSIDE
jgi:hypothetical protein